MLLTLLSLPSFFFTGIRCKTITATSTTSITIMIIVIVTIISVAVTITPTSFTVLVRVFMLSTIVAIIVTFITYCTMNVAIITVSGNASISIPAPTRLLSLSLLVRVPSSAQ